MAFLKVLCPSVRQVRCIFFFFLPYYISASLSGWVDVRTTVPQGVGWKTEFVHLECKEERKLERERDGWMKGGRECGVASDVRPFKGESGNQSRPWPTWCFVPLSTSRHLSVSLFLEESFILLFFFPPTFAFSHSVFGALLRVQPKNLKELSRSPIVKTFSYAFTWVQFQLLLLKMRCVIFLKISLQAVLEGKYLLCLCDVAKGCGSFAYISKFLSCWYNL